MVAWILLVAQVYIYIVIYLVLYQTFSCHFGNGWFSDFSHWRYFIVANFISSLSCLNEYLAIDIGGYVNK